MSNHRKSLAIAVILTSVGLGENAWAAAAGGQFGFGAGFAAGTTHREVGVDGDTYYAGGGGVGLDLAARLWTGPLLVGGTATALTTLFGPKELIATGGAGLKLELESRWRLMSLLEAGSHTVVGVGSGLFKHVVEGGKATLPCFAARLVLVKRPSPTQKATLGITTFFLADWRTEEVATSVNGFLGSSSPDRLRIGGALFGMALHATFGS